MKVFNLFTAKYQKKYQRPNYINAHDLSNWFSKKNESYSNGDTVSVYYRPFGDIQMGEKLLLKGYLFLAKDPFTQSYVYNPSLKNSYKDLYFYIGDYGFSFHESKSLLLEKKFY
jgi:hypothetical protein